MAWYGMVDVCDGCLAAEASGSSFGFVPTLCRVSRAPDYINVGFLGGWGTHACPQLDPDASAARNRHRHLPCHVKPLGQCHWADTAGRHTPAASPKKRHVSCGIGSTGTIGKLYGVDLAFVGNASLS